MTGIRIVLLKAFCFLLITLAAPIRSQRQLYHFDRDRLSDHDAGPNGRNMQTFSFVKHKHIDCGLVNIRDDFQEFDHVVTYDDLGDKLVYALVNDAESESDSTNRSNYNNDYDATEEDRRTKKTRSRLFDYQPRHPFLPNHRTDHDLVANLSSCLNQQSQYYTSYSVHLTSKLTKHLFKAHFHLDEKLGLLFLKKNIDREQLCVQVKQHEGSFTQPPVLTSEEPLIENYKLQNEQPLVRHKSKVKTFYVETSLLKNRQNRSNIESQESDTRHPEKSEEKSHKSNRKHGKKLKNKSGKSKHTTTPVPEDNYESTRSDRDRRMLDSARLRQSQAGSFLSSGINSMPQMDHVDCDCKSETCLVRFRFVAFRRKDMKNAVRDENTMQQLSNYKNILLTFSVNDVNDNLPKFVKNSLYLNVSEQIGSSQPDGFDTQENCLKAQNEDNSKSKTETDHSSSRKGRSMNGYDDASNTLIPLDKAFDLDVGKNSQIVYSLIQMDEKSFRLIDMLEKEALNETIKENLIRTLIDEHTREIYDAVDPTSSPSDSDPSRRMKRSKKCKSAFELIENNLNEDLMVVSDADGQDEQSAKARLKELIPSSSDNNQLYLKINKLLDREQQDVYNFILIAQDKYLMNDLRQYLSRSSNSEAASSTLFARLARKLTKSGHLVHAKNYVFIRLLVTDQNDNFPQFQESKYQFFMNETTEYDLYYTSNYMAATSPMLVKPGLKMKPLSTHKLFRPSIAIGNAKAEEDEETVRKAEENKYYSKLMIDTCLAMRRSIRVTASDKDLGLNALVKFKIIQQVHRKNPNYLSNLSRLSMASFTSGASSIQPTSASWTTSASYTSDNAQSAYNDNSFASSQQQDQFEIDEYDGSIYLKACKPIFETMRQNLSDTRSIWNSNSLIKGLTRSRFLEHMSLLDYELYTKHVLVVEASDSNPFNPLQTFVSVDININDLNDNPPVVLSLISTSCARYGLSKDHAVMSLSSGTSILNSGSFEDKSQNSPPVITIQHMETNSQFISHNSRHSHHKLNQNKFQASSSAQENPYSAKIVIDGLSEYSRIGRCIGQFLISDLDSKRQNRKLDAILTDSLPSLSQDLGIGRDESENSLFIFTNINNREGHIRNGVDEYDDESNLSINQTQKPSVIIKQTNEIFELFLNFEPDAEMQRVYELVLTVKDHGYPVSFVSYAQLIIRIRDENDNEPRFESSFFNFFIDEWTSNMSDNSPTSTDDNYCIGQVEARDLDYSSANSFVYYELKYIDDDEQKAAGSYGHKKHKHHQNGFSQDKSASIDHDNLVRSLFYINQSNGFICVKNRTIFDYEQKQTYKFKVNAINANSDKRLMNSALVQINVNDLNDNRPEFVEKEYKFLVLETDKNYVNSLYITDATSRFSQPKSRVSSTENFNRPNGAMTMNLISHVRAVDKDSGLNAELVYYLRPNDDEYKSYFQLNPHSISKNEKLTLYSLDPESAGSSEAENEREYIEPFEGQGLLENERKHEPSKRLLKLIENIEEVIFVNETSGAVFLLKEIDREQITHIRFNVFVSDRKGVSNSSNALNNSVPVIIEIIDINDSKPVCSNANYIPDNSLRAIYSINMNMNWVSDQASARTQSYEYPIYKLDCVDYDINKNAELQYEIIQVKIKKLVKSKYMRSVKSGSQVESNSDNSASITKRDRNMNDTNLNENTMISLENAAVEMGSKYVNEFFIGKHIFTIKPTTGQIYLNISNAWINPTNASQSTADFNLNKKFRLYIQNSIVILKIKVKDSSMAPLSNVYNVKFRFCLFDADTIYNARSANKSDSAEKYCDYGLLQQYLEKSHFGNGRANGETESQTSVQLKSIVLMPILSIDDVDVKNLIDRPSEYNPNIGSSEDTQSSAKSTNERATTLSDVGSTVAINEDDNIDDSYSGELSSDESQQVRHRQSSSSKIGYENGAMITEKNGDYPEYSTDEYDSKTYIYSENNDKGSSENSRRINSLAKTTNKLHPIQPPHIIKQKTAQSHQNDITSASSAKKLQFQFVTFILLLFSLFISRFTLLN